MKYFIERLISGVDLSDTDIKQTFEEIMSGNVSDVQTGALLVALRAKRETPSEIASAASFMRSKALNIDLGFDVVDTCGTGGDNSSTFNISTAVAFVLAGAGLKVAKHGNRAVSSPSGSADCLEALGVSIDLGPKEAADAIKKNGFAFLFAPKYHPSMKHAMPARRQLGIRTIFNVLGPLANPANASYQVVGVYSRDLIKPVAQALFLMGLKGAMVVSAGIMADALDEASIAGTTYYARLNNGQVTFGEIRPEDAGITPGPIESIKSSSPKESANIIEGVFEGRLRGPYLDIILLNAAAGFMAVDGTIDIKEGMNMASEVITKGAAIDALNRARA